MRVFVLIALVGALLTGATRLAAGSESPAGVTNPTTPTHLDLDLARALRQIGADGRYLAASPFDDRVDLVMVESSTELDRSRTEVLRIAELIAGEHEARSQARRQLRRIDNAIDDVRSIISMNAVGGIDPAMTQQRIKELQQLRLVIHDRRLDDLADRVDATRLDALAAMRAEGLVGLSAATQTRIDDELTKVRADASSMASVLATPSIDEANAWAALDVLIADLHGARRLRPSLVGGLPLVTLDAYVVGAKHGVPGCSVEWPLLAAIGAVESLHGTLNDAAVGGDGDVTPPIFGPLLDGGASDEAAIAAAQAESDRVALAAELEAAEQRRLFEEEQERLKVLFGDAYRAPDADDAADSEATAAGEADDGAATDGAGEDAGHGDGEPDDDGNGFAVIEDTDEGRVDGNPDWDRAVGPMQFLPQTWALFGADGSQDGIADPHNFYDAASSAASYLCHLERRNNAGPEVFLFGYNDSSTYVERVITIAAEFALFELTSS